MRSIDLLSKITEKESMFEAFLNELKSYETPLLLYGAGSIANFYYDALIGYGINISQVVVSDSHIDRYKHHMFKNRNVMSISEALEVYGESNVLIAFAVMSEKELENKLLTTKNVKKVLFFDMMNILYDNFINLPYDFVYENNKLLCQLYDEFSDDMSKDHLIRILNQRISGNTKYLGSINFVDELYFPDFIQLSKDEVFVDCGAYIGDTIKSFIEHCSRVGGYKKIYALEPDPYSFRELEKLYAPNVVYVNKGAWYKSDTLKFSSGMEKISRVDETATMSIEVDSIDNILNGQKATFIKMDIEGSELEALRGAKRTIMKFKPKLAISVYHKKEDLISIPSYLRSLGLDYKFFLRAHQNLTADFVLYTV